MNANCNDGGITSTAAKGFYRHPTTDCLLLYNTDSLGCSIISVGKYQDNAVEMSGKHILYRCIIAKK